MAAYVYILTCADGSYYVGSTRSYARLDAHHLGLGATWTKKRLPVVVSWIGEFSNIGEAYDFERRLHGWSRAKKQAIVEGRWVDLPGLSRCQPSTTDADCSPGASGR